MKDFISKLTFTALCVLVTFSAIAAEKVTFEVNTPLTVAVGEAFRVEFSVNAKPDNNSFKAPSFDGFEVLAGPALSTGQSVQIINNTMTKSISNTYTYVLQPKAAGTHTIGAAEIAVEGVTYRTRPQPIEVVDEGGGSSRANASANSRRTDDEEDNADLQSRIGRNDILLRAVVSRTSTFKNDPIRVTYKLYSRVPYVNIVPESSPSFNGFWAQDLISDPNSLQPGRESYNGSVYNTQILYDYLLYPQQTGALTIDPVAMTVTARVIVQSRRNIDPFFGGGHEVYDVPRKVQSQRVTVNVKPLPAGAPASFTGAVGNFSMDAKLPTERIAANSGATFTVKISGTGNLTFVQAPKLPLPTSFEQYNVKTTESINASPSGISGYRQFEYPFIARAEGTYEIEPIEFSYFDPQRMQYVILKSRPVTLDITPDAKGGTDAVVMQGRGMSKEEVKLLGQDIRFITLGAAQLHTGDRPLLFSGLYWALLAAIFALFGGAYASLRKQIRESQNIVLMRGKRASKVAVQRFRAAKGFMEQQNRHAFYEEMLRALWGYMSDRFNIPVANLTKENVREELSKRGVSSDEAQRFTAIITQCDEAQYSPSASAQMNEVYTEGVDLISRIEVVIKR